MFGFVMIPVCIHVEIAHSIVNQFYVIPGHPKLITVNLGAKCKLAFLSQKITNYSDYCHKKNQLIPIIVFQITTY